MDKTTHEMKMANWTWLIQDVYYETIIMINNIKFFTNELFGFGI